MKDIKIIEANQPLTVELVQRWYLNIPLEISRGYLPAGDAAYFAEYYREAGLLRTWRRSFFMRHYAESFAAAANYIMAAPSRRKTVVDLGCGSGTQSIALALMGAKVVGLDMDRRALDILLRRKAFYERETGRTLDIEVYDGDVFSFDYKTISPIDGVYSMFAFNMMQPTTGLFDLLLPRMKTGARFVIQDGNRMSWLGLLPGRHRKVLSPIEFDREITLRGFKSELLRGAISIPPLVWCLAPSVLLKPFDEFMNGSWFCPISYMAMYEKSYDASMA